jgi:16S rRNA (guanine966-N2)-methyltransferase
VTRIIAGTARGRRLAVPASGTRPTSDRVRESLFSALDSELIAQARSWAGLRVLDLFAGTGALGLEALSRGATEAYLVESSRPAIKVLEANIAAVGCPGARVISMDVARLPAQAPPADGAGLCFADPPYEWPAADVQALLSGLGAAGWLAVGARVVVERAARDRDSPLPDAWPDVRQRAYGDTMLWYGRCAAAETSPGSLPEGHHPTLGAS